MKLRATLILLLCCLVCSAETVDRDRAEKAAMNFFGLPQTRTAGQLTLVWDGEPAGTKSGSQPAFFVFDRAGGGFVIIAGEDSVEPVLGYALSGNFVSEDMPENLADWMAELREGILELRKKGVMAASGDWTASATKGQTVIQHETALWNQKDPYNRLCPKIMGDATYTGCVATAIAIVMRWNRWPAAGKGTLPGYDYTDHYKNKQVVPERKLGHTYNWDNMPLKMSGATESQKDEVAQLMYDCGVMTEMEFDTDGSATALSNVMTTLPVYMGYDAGLTLESKEYYSNGGWVSMLKKGLDDGPLLFSGHSSSGGGHAFVIAGYDSTDKFYINWGWGGSDNGWYTYPTFSKYTNSHKTYLGVRKDCGNPAMPAMVSGVLKANTGVFEVGKKFTLTASHVFNYGAGSLTGLIAAGRLRSDNTLDIISEAHSIKGLKFFYGYSSMTFTSTLPSAVREGDKLGIFYQIDGESKWRSVSYDLEAGAGMLAIDGAADIGKETSVFWTIETRTLTVTSLSSATVSLIAEDGRTVSSGKGTITANSVSAGKYTLRITLGSAVKNVKLTL